MKKSLMMATLALMSLASNSTLAGKCYYPNRTDTLNPNQIWKCGNAYTTDPQNKCCEKYDARTGKPILKQEFKELSLAEQQFEVARKIAAKNDAIALENAHIDSANCQAARTNLQVASNSPNRNELMPRYERDVARYCGSASKTPSKSEAPAPAPQPASPVPPADLPAPPPL